MQMLRNHYHQHLNQKRQPKLWPSSEFEFDILGQTKKLILDYCFTKSPLHSSPTSHIGLPNDAMKNLILTA
jgi:hypothetical protein